jgi:hypothetical protein
MAKDITNPIYNAYTVIKREGQDDYWLNVGAAFSHQDGNGLNIILQAMPLNGKIVLRPPKDSTDDVRPPAKNAERRNEKRRER